MATKKKGKPGAAAPQKLSADQILNQIRRLAWEPDEELRNANSAVHEAEAAVEAAKRDRDFVAERLRLVRDALGAGLKAAKEMKSYDPDLLKVLQKCGPWETLREKGGSNDAIRAQLKKGPGYAKSTQNGRIAVRGGESPAVWIDAPTYDKPTLSGDALINESRRVLGIPKPANKPPPGGGGSSKSKPAAKMKKPAPSRPAAARPVAASAAAGIVSARRVVGHDAKSKMAEAMFGDIPKPVLSFLKKLDQAEALWGVRTWRSRTSTDSSRELFTDRLSSAVRERQINERLSELAKKAGVPLDAASPTPKSEPTQEHVSPAQSLGIAPAELEAAVSPKLYPRQGFGPHGHVPLIGEPIKHANALWACTLASQQGDATTYRLQEVLDPRGRTRLSYATIVQGHPNTAPEGLPLKGLEVDCGAKTFVVGDRTLFVSVKKEKHVEATAVGQPAGLLQQIIPGASLRRPNGPVFTVLRVNRDDLGLLHADCELAGKLRGKRKGSDKHVFTMLSDEGGLHDAEGAVELVSPAPATSDGGTERAIVPPGVECHKPVGGEYKGADQIDVAHTSSSSTSVFVVLAEDGFWRGSYDLFSIELGVDMGGVPKHASESFTTRSWCIHRNAVELEGAVRKLLDTHCKTAEHRKVVERLLEQIGEFQELRRCRICGCTEDNCEFCEEHSGGPCSWIEADLCTACFGLDPAGEASHAAPRPSLIKAAAAALPAAIPDAKSASPGKGGVAFRPQTWGQWRSTILGISKITVRDDDEAWRALFDRGLRPSDAVREFKSSASGARA